MPINQVIVNTSPIICLDKSGLIDLLPALFKEIAVPEEVCREILAKGKENFSGQELLSADWLKRVETICLKEKGLKVSKIIVFGSQAKGTATEESDIDIVIVSEDFKRKNIFRRADLTKDAEIRTIRKFMVSLDIITMTPEEYENKTTLMAEYAHEGEVVFAS